MMAGLTLTRLSVVMGLFVSGNGLGRSIKVNCTDKDRHACLGRKPAWMLVFEIYKNKKNISSFFINNFSLRARNRVCKRGCLFCQRYSIWAVFERLGYHNAVATEVASMEVASV